MQELMLRKLPEVTQLKCDEAEAQTQQPICEAPALEFDSPGPRVIHGMRILLPQSPVAIGYRDSSVLLGKLLKAPIP